MNISSFIQSDKADELGIRNVPNEEMEVRSLLFLHYAVEPLEELFLPHALVFHSGYRCTKLNAAVKGRTFSQHLRGNALDFHVQDFTVEDAYRVILHSSLRYDQVILEGRPGHQWVHFSYNTDLPANRQRMENLTIPDP